MQPEKYRGEIQNLPNEEYHGSPGLSKSGLVQFSKTPRHYWYHYLSGKKESKSTEALRFGNAFHCYLLEPDLFAQTYIYNPGLKFTTKAGKEWREANCDKIVLSEADRRMIELLNSAVQTHPRARVMLKLSGFNEISYYWPDPETGVWMKSRPDKFLDVINVVVDIKTADTVDPTIFQKKAMKYHYHVSAALTLDGLEAVRGERPHEYIFMVFEKNPPYNLVCFNADPGFIELGRQEYKSLLPRFKECMEKNEWPGYPQDIVPLSVPERKMNA